MNNEGAPPTVLPTIENVTELREKLLAAQATLRQSLDACQVVYDLVTETITNMSSAWLKAQLEPPNMLAQPRPGFVTVTMEELEKEFKISKAAMRGLQRSFGFPTSSGILDGKRVYSRPAVEQWVAVTDWS